MEKLKRFIDVVVPTNRCNLACGYCYVTMNNLAGGRVFTLERPPGLLRAAFSRARLGGTCLFNVCACGETLLSGDVIALVEAALRAHPGVADAAVIGRPDPVRGTVLEARVVAREGAAPTEAELLAHCRARLADPKVPRRVALITEIPRSPSGKSLRRALRGGPQP